MNKRKLLSDLRANVESLQFEDKTVESFLKKGQLYIRKIFGNNSCYLEDLQNINFNPSCYYTGMPQKNFIDSFERGRIRFLNLIDVMLEDIMLEETSETELIKNHDTTKGNKIFIVHGHDEALRQTVARFVAKLRLEPIILGEKPTGGVKSILEKIEEYSDVRYAIVLLSPCDEGHKKGTDELEPRARQNVVAELGYFIGKLGRNNVSILKKGIVEFPSDFLGNYYIDYENTNWSHELFQELKTAGFQIDANDIMQ